MADSKQSNGLESVNGTPATIGSFEIYSLGLLGAVEELVNGPGSRAIQHRAKLFYCCKTRESCKEVQ